MRNPGLSPWRWRGRIALLGVALAFVIYPFAPNVDVISSDWPAFATGARLIVTDPIHLYDLDAQARAQSEVTGGRVLISLGIHGILPFLTPAWVALLALPFESLGSDLGGRLWMLFQLLCLGAGLYLATRPRGPTAVLPAFASVPTALLLVNAQLDGVVVLGLGAAVSLWSRPYLAGLALSLTLVKPQLVLPLGAAALISRQWKALAGWAAGGLVLLAPTLVLSPRWITDWLGQIRTTVMPASREVDLPHFATVLPSGLETAGLVALTLAAVALVVLLARRRRADIPATAAVLIAGGAFAAPHALPADLVLPAMAMAVWSGARWFEWLGLSIAALICALAPVPIPAIVGVIAIGWICLRAAGVVTWPSPGPAPASAR